MGEQPQTMAEKLLASAKSYVNALGLRPGVFVAECVQENPSGYGGHSLYRFRVVRSRDLPVGSYVIMRWERTLGHLGRSLNHPLVLLLDSDVLAIEPDPEETRRD